MNCARHPNVETALTCGKCGTPICPKCLVQTPVGARCPSCANLKRVPTYQVSSRYYLRAIGAGLGIALATGLAWGFFQLVLPIFYLNLLLAGAVGFAIGEVISLSVNRKSGTGLAVIGSAAAIISFAIYMVISGGIFSGELRLAPIAFDILELLIAIFVSIARLR